MATFSPSPAPRRSTHLRPQVNTPPKRIRIGNSSGPTSRLATPIRNAGYLADNASIASGMDVDETNSVLSSRSNARISAEAVFAKSDELCASFYANLPIEVKQVLKNADFYGDAYTGDIDTLTGFALVASAQTCFVWQHAQAVKGIPTCYIFSCPVDYNQGTPPFHALVPYNSAREPGLILISVVGEIRFWDSIGIGLAGGDHYFTTNLDLTSEEFVTDLIRSDPQTFISSTTSGRLFRLTLTSAGGKQHLTSHPFSRPQPSLSLSRLIPSLFSPSPPTANASHNIVPESGNISAIALGEKTPTGGREIWALIDTRIQRWDMKVEGWEQILLDEEVADIIRTAVREAFGPGVEQDDASLDLELVDLAIDNEGKLVVLVSYAGLEDDTAMAVDMSGVRRIYSLLRLSLLGDLFRVESARSVPYQSTSTSGAPMHPRIQLILEGLLVSIQFGDAVALCARDSDYRDRLELKSATDRTLGIGVVQSDSTVLVLTAATMMKVDLDMDNVRNFNPETGRANLIKSTMMQAILYGSSPDNPLHFSFAPDVDEESLMQGAEQLSQAILESDTEVVRKNHDLTAQLTGRKERLSWLIRFINDNVVLVKMSQRSRQKLATDAEKLYASHQLWIQHNDLLAKAPSRSVLNDAAYAYMTDIGESHHEDVIRTFFRTRVQDIGQLVQKVPEVMNKASQEPGYLLADSLSEANRIVLTVLKSALDYRDYNLGVYGIELPMIKPWTSRPPVIDVLLELFDSTMKVTESPTPARAAQQNSQEPNAQLPELASLLFVCIQERLDWLASAIAADEPSTEQDRNELEQKFALLRPDILDTLRRAGHADAAFALAEKYRDFSSLAALCHKDGVYPPNTNPNASRIQLYIDKFKDEFVTELYRWYIQHGELRVMFAQGDMHSGYMDRFFAENPNPAISWIHDLGQGRHEVAAATLLDEAGRTTNLEAKHLMLSIGKLSHLARLHEAEAATVDEKMLDIFHDELDIVSVHEALLQEFKSALESVRGRRSLDTQIDTILSVKASSLSDRLALSHVFKELIRDLLHGKSLSIEDVVDLLSLKDNSNTPEDYATALLLLARAQNIPETRKLSAFRSIWRRIYIRDDWHKIRQTANITDLELNERFRRTTLYSVFHAIFAKDQREEIHDVTPESALIVPTISEVTSRWPGMSPEQVEAIMQDFQLECDKLGELAINDVYYRVEELAAHETVW